MLPTSRWVVGALVLLLVAGLAALLLALSGAPVVGYVGVLVLLIAASTLVLISRRSTARPAADRSRLDLDRLRPGRLRDYGVWAHGYERQLVALAETLPHLEARARLVGDLPAVTAASRAVYDLCLSLQAYELAESQPPALRAMKSAEIAAVTADADLTLQVTLATLSEGYGQLRSAWSSVADGAPGTEVLAELVPLTARLRSHAATFAPAPRAPVERRTQPIDTNRRRPR